MLKPEYNLSNIQFFEGLSARELDSLAKGCRWRRYTAGQQIIGHQDETKDVYFVVSGSVRVTIYSAPGKEVMFRDLGSGKSFGELSAIDGEPRSASVIALTRSILAAMPADRFHRALRDHPTAAR